MEELFYWLVILAFYLFSAYRSRKKKAIPRPLEKEVKDVIPAVPPQTKSVLDFLNDAFEKMEAEVEIPKPPRSVKKPIKPIDIVPPKVGINYKPGIWHFPLISTEDTDFLVIDRKGNGKNLIIHNFNKEEIILKF